MFSQSALFGRPVLVALWVCSLAVNLSLVAEEKAEEIAIIDPVLANQDPDFSLQGEFVGFWNAGEYAGQKMGLQITSQGKGEFLALEYLGGLPGGGWDQFTRRWWGGTRHESTLSLQTAGLKGEFTTNQGTLRDEQGNVVAELKRVRRWSSTLGAPPPEGATVLFNGSDTGEFEAPKITTEGLLAEGTITKRPFQDFQMHLEFMTPFKPLAREQGRGNSGVYLQERYELQILDSFGQVGRFNECGSLYRTEPPFENMALPPLTWQTYDIDFVAARFDSAGQKISPTTISIRHNGVVIHNHYQLPNKTGAGKPEGPEPRPIKLQDHHNPVRYRNIWIVEGASHSLQCDEEMDLTFAD